MKLKLLQLLYYFLILFFQILMNVQSAIRVEMVHAPMSLGVLNAIATKALSQGPWWIVKASDNFSYPFFPTEKELFNVSAVIYIVLINIMIILITNIFSFISLSIVTTPALKPLSDHSSISVISELASVDCLFPWEWIAFSWLLIMLLNFGLYPGYCEWYFLELVLLLLRILMHLS